MQAEVQVEALPERLRLGQLTLVLRERRDLAEELHARGVPVGVRGEERRQVPAVDRGIASQGAVASGVWAGRSAAAVGPTRAKGRGSQRGRANGKRWSVSWLGGALGVRGNVREDVAGPTEIFLPSGALLAILPNNHKPGETTMDARTQALFEARARVLKAMAHPTRLYIVEQLSHAEHCVGDLQELIGADVSTVSKHLAILNEAGLLRREKRANQVFYP